MADLNPVNLIQTLIINARLSALSTYIKTKAFGWTLDWNLVLLITKTKKKFESSKFFIKTQISFQNFLKNQLQNSFFPFVQICSQF